MMTLFRRFLKDDLGVEAAQFVLIVPILVGLLWSSFEAWQIMSLRSTMRTAVSQSARYVTAYAAPAEEIWDQLPPAEVYWQNMVLNIEDLIEGTLARHKGILGDTLYWETTWVLVTNPLDPAWEGNTTEYPMDQTIPFLSGLPCNQPFGLRLEVMVPWRTLLLGLPGVSSRDFVLALEDTAVGTAPCLPRCELHAYVDYAAGTEGCATTVHWFFTLNDEFTHIPNQVWVVDGDNDLLGGPWDASSATAAGIAIPCGDSQIRVMAGEYNGSPSNSWVECEATTIAQCNCGGPGLEAELTPQAEPVQ